MKKRGHKYSTERLIQDSAFLLQSHASDVDHAETKIAKMAAAREMADYMRFLANNILANIREFYGDKKEAAETISASAAMPGRMLSKREATAYCRIAVARFPSLCPVPPLNMGGGLKAYDIEDLDRWIDSLKGNRDQTTEEALIGRIRKDRQDKPRYCHCPPERAASSAKCLCATGSCGRNLAAFKPDTLGRLVSEYEKSSAFADLAKSTKLSYLLPISRLMPLFDIKLHNFTPPFIVKLRDAAARDYGREAGNKIKIILSVIFAWGREHGFIENNPAAGIKALKRPKDAPKPNRPWTDAERETVLAALPAHMALPFALMIYCGLDIFDALSLPRSSIKDGLIDTKRAKTKQPVWIPVPLFVKDCLAAQPPHNAKTVCVNSLGLPWTIGGFNTNWRRIKARLLAENKISPGLTLKGTRHTVATILAEMGYDDRTIADMLGQRTLAMAQHYSNRANRSRKLSAVVKKFEKEMNRRRAETAKLARKISLSP